MVITRLVRALENIRLNGGRRIRENTLGETMSDKYDEQAEEFMKCWIYQPDYANLATRLRNDAVRIKKLEAALREIVSEANQWEHEANKQGWTAIEINRRPLKKARAALGKK
jgi:hypothetical protein